MEKILVVTGLCFKPKEKISLVPKRERVTERELLDRTFVAVISGKSPFYDGTMKDNNGLTKLFCIELGENAFSFTQQCLDAPRPRPGYLIYAFQRKDNIWVGTYTDYARGEQIEGACRCFLNETVHDLFSPPYNL
jgi:hypothetical protein